MGKRWGVLCFVEISQGYLSFRAPLTTSRLVYTILVYTLFALNIFASHTGEQRDVVKGTFFHSPCAGARPGASADAGAVVQLWWC